MGILKEKRVRISGVEGYKDREPFAVNVKTAFKTKSYNQYSLTTTSPIGITQPVYDVAFVQSEAIIQVEKGSIRWRTDGGNPSQTTGMMLTDGQSMRLMSIDDIKNFKMVKTSTDVIVNVTIFEKCYE